MKAAIRLLCFLLLSVAGTFSSYGQMEDYNYKREINGVSDQWHKIILPNEVFEKTSQNLADIRIFGLTEGNDTIEAPYLLRLTTEIVSDKDVSFKTLNASRNEKGYYFTFEVPTEGPINQIKLQFKQENFDWRIRLEGSQDLNEWYTVLEDYRILSITNDLTDFQFTKLAFPSSKYRYFRLHIESKEKPELRVASLARHEVAAGNFRGYSIKKIDTKENKQTKQTEIDVELQSPVRVSRIRIGVSDTFDYYRPVTIKYLRDSLKTDQGWKYNYGTLTSGILNSMEENEFKFTGTTVQKLKLVIDNRDNQPLVIDTIRVEGYIHELVVRFTDRADYFLTYGNERVTKPQYDIARFTDNISGSLTTLELGDEVKIDKKAVAEPQPLFKNKTWLWAIMALIILVLGWFSVRMMRKG